MILNHLQLDRVFRFYLVLDFALVWFPIIFRPSQLQESTQVVFAAAPTDDTQMQKKFQSDISNISGKVDDFDTKNFIRLEFYNKKSILQI